tara:strand:+ start:3625 stop:3873 length:249 start_codon:yes stop_codon:yes gene_type:complete
MIMHLKKNEPHNIYELDVIEGCIQYQDIMVKERKSWFKVKLHHMVCFYYEDHIGNYWDETLGVEFPYYHVAQSIEEEIMLPF